jgi:hypothetical protein
MVKVAMDCVDIFARDWALLIVLTSIMILALIGLGALCYMWIVWTFREILED